MRKQSGFTLIELVIVVVILGFLAVTAIPKFLDLTDQAKKANIEGMAGGFATAVSLVRSQWESEGRPKSENLNSVDYDGVRLLLTSEKAAVAADVDTTASGAIRPGYVVSTWAGKADGTELLNPFAALDCVKIWQNIFQQPPGVASDIGVVNSNPSIDYFAAKSGANETSTCHYYLKATLSKNATTGLYEAPTSGSVAQGNSFTYQPATSAVAVYINN